MFCCQAQRRCCLKHVQSLWCLLSHMKARRFHELRHVRRYFLHSCKSFHEVRFQAKVLRSILIFMFPQDPFDNVDVKYKEELTADMRASLHSALQHTNVALFMAELHECILLHITVKRDADAEDDDTDNAKYPLVHRFVQYCSAGQFNVTKLRHILTFYRVQCVFSRLGYSLHEYIEGRNATPSPILMDPRFPTDVLLKHCTATWREAYEYQQQNKHQH